MSIYGKYSHVFLENTCDVDNITYDIKTSSYDLYDNIISYYYNFPLIDDTIQSFVNTFQTNNFQFLSNIITNLNGKNIGYNQLKIQEHILGDYSKILDKVTDHDILSMLGKLNIIYDKYNHDYVFGMNVLPLYFKDVFSNITPVRTYKYLHYFNKIPYEHLFIYDATIQNPRQYEEQSAFLNIILHDLIRQNINTINFKQQFLRYIDGRFENLYNDIISNIETYLIDRIDSICHDFYKFIINNNLFIYYESNNFKNHVSHVFKKYIIDNLQPIIRQTLLDIIKTVDITSICDNVCDMYSKYIAYLTLVNNIYVENNLNFFESDINKLINFEDNLYDLLTSRFQTNYHSQLQQLQYIITQFKDNPLFYINSQQYIHYLWISSLILINDYRSLMLEYKSFNNPWDIIGDVLDQISIDDDECSNVINSIIDNTTGENYYNCLKLILNDQYDMLIQHCFKSDKIVNSIILDLIPALLSDIHSDYYVTIDDKYKLADRTMWFLKCFFKNAIFNGTIFDSIILDIYNNTHNYIDNCVYDEQHLKDSLSTLSRYNYNFYEFFDMFFISARTTQYVNDYLRQFSVYKY